VSASRVGELLVDVGDQLLAVGFAAHCLCRGLRRDLPRGCVVAIGWILRDGGGDRGKCAVQVFVDARVEPEDQVRLERGDLFDADRGFGIAADDGRFGSAPRSGHPRPRAVDVRLTRVLIDHADGLDAQGQQSLLVVVADGDDPLWFGIDRGAAEGVIDRDGEGAASGSRRTICRVVVARSAGDECCADQRDQGNGCQSRPMSSAFPTVAAFPTISEGDIHGDVFPFSGGKPGSAPWCRVGLPY